MEYSFDFLTVAHILHMDVLQTAVSASNVQMLFL